MRFFDRLTWRSLKRSKSFKLERWNWGKVREIQREQENSTHESLSTRAFSPQCRSPLFLQAEFLEGLLHDACWCGEGEFDNELGQMQVADWVLLSWNATQWTVDEDLEVDGRRLISD
jgi:hypothetical protein